MIEKIDYKITMLLKYRDSDQVMNNAELRGWICNTIAHCYNLENCILASDKKLNNYSDNFFTANATVSRYYRDRGLDEVADIYNELCLLAGPYLKKEKILYARC